MRRRKANGAMRLAETGLYIRGLRRRRDLIAMSNGESWFFSISFGIVTCLLLSIRGRLNRIEEKLDKMGDK